MQAFRIRFTRTGGNTDRGYLCSSLFLPMTKKKEAERDIGQEILDAVREIKEGGGKRIRKDESPLSAVTDTLDDEALSMDEINEIVHQVRRARRKR